MDDLQKAALEPFADRLHTFLSPLVEMGDIELRQLLRACEAANGTNCWFRSYEAAQILKKEIPSILTERAKNARSA